MIIEKICKYIKAKKSARLIVDYAKKNLWKSDVRRILEDELRVNIMHKFNLTNGQAQPFAEQALHELGIMEDL